MKISRFILIFTVILIFAACGKGSDSVYDYPDDEENQGKTDSDKITDGDPTDPTNDGDPTDPTNDGDPTDPTNDVDDHDDQDEINDNDNDNQEIPDGEINFENAVFVDQFNGNDSNSGTKSAPVQTLGKAVQLSNAIDRNQIIVSWGFFEEIPLLKSGVSIFGEYFNNNGNWIKTDDENMKPVFNSPASGLIINQLQNITLSSIKINSAAPSLPGGSSIGLILNRCKNIRLRNVSIVTSDAANGDDGEDGTQGDNGEDGEDGISGCEESSAYFCQHQCSETPVGAAGGLSTCGANGGKGGDAGYNKDNGQPGENGYGSTTNGGPGGEQHYWNANALGHCSRAYSTAINGKNGENGESGEDGIGGKSFGTFSSSGYTPSDGTDGENGKNGQGGGGGGGGKGGNENCDSYGSSGGGGGAGGCGGTGGTGGKGGGASVSLIAVSSSNIYIESPVFETGKGGQGGKGGKGGTRGFPGKGGSSGEYSGETEQDDAGCGGFGGDGGFGGFGGAGGGGGGGPAVCIVTIGNSSVYSSNIKCLLGQSGNGGSSSVNSGEKGYRENILNIE